MSLPLAQLDAIGAPPTRAISKIRSCWIQVSLALTTAVFLVLFIVATLQRAGAERDLAALKVSEIYKLGDALACATINDGASMTATSVISRGQSPLISACAVMRGSHILGEDQIELNSEWKAPLPLALEPLNACAGKLFDYATAASQDVGVEGALAAAQLQCGARPLCINRARVVATGATITCTDTDGMCQPLREGPLATANASQLSVPPSCRAVFDIDTNLAMPRSVAPAGSGAAAAHASGEALMLQRVCVAEAYFDEK